jgi:hypothetical protein
VVAPLRGPHRRGARRVVPRRAGAGGRRRGPGDRHRQGDPRRPILPPTRAGWQRFLGLAPKSGESYTTLKEIGLEWWGRKIPQNLLSGAKEKSAEADTEAESDAVKVKACAASKRRRVSSTTLTAEQVEQMQELLQRKRDAEPEAPEELDQRVIENLALTHAAMNDALAMGGASKADRRSSRRTPSRTPSASPSCGRSPRSCVAAGTRSRWLARRKLVQHHRPRRQVLAAAAQAAGVVRYAPGLAEDVQTVSPSDLAEARQRSRTSSSTRRSAAGRGSTRR